VGLLVYNAGANQGMERFFDAPLVAYCASKAFTQGLGEGLWSELKPKGVDVAYIVVGAVDTPNRARQATAPDPSKPVDPDNPNNTVFPPEEIAQAALDELGRGPVCVPAKLVRFYDQLVSLPRDEASNLMKRMLSGFKETDPAH
jgi:short-subunit dehydrogenase